MIENTIFSDTHKSIAEYKYEEVKMQNFYINIDGITKSTNELLDVSNGINTVALKVSDIAQDLKNIGLGQLSGYAVRISAKSSGLQILQDVSEKINFLKIFRINMDLMMIKEILGEIICKQD